MKSYREVSIPKDPKKDRLRLKLSKLKSQGIGNKLTQKEIEESIEDILEILGVKLV